MLPGFAPDSKIRMLVQLAAEAEVVIAINAADIEKNKVRGDLGITYDQDVLFLIILLQNRTLLYELLQHHLQKMLLLFYLDL